MLRNDVAIENCKQCKIYILDFTSQVTIDDCVDCTIIIGPSDGSVFARDCTQCTIYSCSRQFRTRSLTYCKLFLFVVTDPIIEMSNHLIVGSWNVIYNFLELQRKRAKFDKEQNHFNKIFDFNEARDGQGKNSNWRLATETEQQESILELENRIEPSSGSEANQTAATVSEEEMQKRFSQQPIGSVNLLTSQPEGNALPKSQDNSCCLIM